MPPVCLSFLPSEWQKRKSEARKCDQHTIYTTLTTEVPRAFLKFVATAATAIVASAGAIGKGEDFWR
jgi:hypothetical protein